MALFGGFALIVPMLIMTLHQIRLTTLLTTSMFVVVVAIILLMFIDTAEPKDVVGATAAYAAVLVVFVGTASINQDGQLSSGNIALIVVGSVVGIIGLLLLILWWNSEIWFQTELLLKANREPLPEKLKSDHDQHAQSLETASKRDGEKTNAERSEDHTDFAKVAAGELKDHEPSQFGKTKPTFPKDQTSIMVQNVKIHNQGNSVNVP